MDHGVGPPARRAAGGAPPAASDDGDYSIIHAAVLRLDASRIDDAEAQRQAV